MQVHRIVSLHSEVFPKKQFDYLQSLGIRIPNSAHASSSATRFFERLSGLDRTQPVVSPSSSLLFRSAGSMSIAGSESESWRGNSWLVEVWVVAFLGLEMAVSPASIVGTG
jgi:hypothetical protein